MLERLDTPALVVSDIGETLVQNPLAVALLGDQTRHTGMARSIVFRWFTDPEERALYPESDHDLHASAFVANLRATAARMPEDERTRLVVNAGWST